MKAGKTTVGSGAQVPPPLQYVLIFFDQAGFPETEAKRFYEHFQEMDWRGLKGGLIRNWKTKAQEWLWAIKVDNPYLRFK